MSADFRSTTIGKKDGLQRVDQEIPHIADLPALLWNKKTTQIQQTIKAPEQLFFSDKPTAQLADANGAGWVNSQSGLNNSANTTQLTPATSMGNLVVAQSSVLNNFISDCHLRAGSPAIDAGINTQPFHYGSVMLDKDLLPRDNDYDIGAYEYHP